MNGLANEIAKNLVLAGVGHLHVLDGGTVTAEDVATGALFSVGAAAVGTPRAKAFCNGLQPMNPAVKFEAIHKHARELAAAELRSYHFVIGTDGAASVPAPGRPARASPRPAARPPRPAPPAARPSALPPPSLHRSRR